MRMNAGVVYASEVRPGERQRSTMRHVTGAGEGTAAASRTLRGGIAIHTRDVSNNAINHANALQVTEMKGVTVNCVWASKVTLVCDVPRNRKDEQRRAPRRVCQQQYSGRPKGNHDAARCKKSGHPRRPAQQYRRLQVLVVF